MARGWHGDSAGHSRAAKKGARRHKLVGSALGGRYGSVTPINIKSVAIAGKVYNLKRDGILPRAPSTVGVFKRKKHRRR